MSAISVSLVCRNRAARTVAFGTRPECHRRNHGSGRTVAFPGAIVRVEGLPGSTTSDERGRFRLGNVPAGSYTLIVSYVGTEDTSISIQVPEEGIDLGDVVIGATSVAALEEIIVVGQAQRLRVRSTRNAPQITWFPCSIRIPWASSRTRTSLNRCVVSQVSAWKPIRARGVMWSFAAWIQT